MARTRKPAAMTPNEFLRIIADSGLTRSAVADSLGVSRFAVYNWLNGKTPISAPNAVYIRARIIPLTTRR